MAGTIPTRTVHKLFVWQLDDDPEARAEFAVTYPNRVNAWLSRGQGGRWDPGAGLYYLPDGVDETVASAHAPSYGVPSCHEIPRFAEDVAGEILTGLARCRFLDGDRSPQTVRRLRIFLRRSDLRTVAGQAGMTLRDFYALDING